MTCKTCGLPPLNGGKCPVFGSAPNPDETCPAYQSEVHTCNLCGQPIMGKSIVDITDETSHLMCAQCAAAGDSCRSCRNAYCAFEQDTTCQEPPYIMQTVRQGNMTMQTQVRNLERVKATCAKACPCFCKESLDCLRQLGYCSNYSINWRN